MVSALSSQGCVVLILSSELCQKLLVLESGRILYPLVVAGLLQSAAVGWLINQTRLILWESGMAACIATTGLGRIRKVPLVLLRQHVRGLRVHLVGVLGLIVILDIFLGVVQSVWFNIDLRRLDLGRLIILPSRVRCQLLLEISMSHVFAVHGRVIQLVLSYRLLESVVGLAQLRLLLGTLLSVL